MSIKIDSVSKKIKSAYVLDGISIELESGKIYGLKGKNGSGKTMLMRTICGLINPTDGFIEINGKVLGKDISFPESIGVLIESPAFIPNYSGFKNLKTIASIKNIASDEDIINVIEQVGLDPYDKKKYKKYSLGMKQRLGIACAVFENPEIIILDEPTNALDVKGVELVRDILASHKSRGATIIIACHDKDELELLSDEIFSIENGKVTDHQVINRADGSGESEKSQ